MSRSGRDDFGWRKKIIQGLEREVPYPFRNPGRGTPAAVLLLLAMDERGHPAILLTRRTEKVETHKGQYALPGGMRDPQDSDLRETALREAEEEVGTPRDQVELLGELPPIWTPTGFEITPFVGLHADVYPSVSITPNPDEIDFWFWCGLDRFRAEGVYRQETRKLFIQGREHLVPTDVYQIDEHKIWGATGAILRNFISRF